MIQKEFAVERKTLQDPLTRLEVVQLTAGDYNNYHLYFTDNSFSLGDQELYFLSDRASAKPEVYNFFRIDLKTGEITQITNEPTGIIQPTKSPDSEWLVYVTGNKVKKIQPKTGKADTIYEAVDGSELGMTFISPDKQYVGFTRNEYIGIQDSRPNYQGFKERFYSIKKAWVTLAKMDGSQALDVFEDTHWLGHFQFSPIDPILATFCHEGPWNLVNQRIWILDIVSRSVKPCFRQGEDDCVGHEFWTRDGVIFFDNRRKGHDGTITSNKTQATSVSEATDQVPYVGLADSNGEVLKTISLPYYCNHYHANNDNTILVGDEVENLVLIDIKNQAPSLKKLCTHHTSWGSHQAHCHPTFGWNCEQILFTSDRDGKCNLYMVDLRQID